MPDNQYSYMDGPEMVQRDRDYRRPRDCQDEYRQGYRQGFRQGYRDCYRRMYRG